MGTFIAVAALMFVGACIAGFLRVKLGSQTPRATTRPVDAHGGFATGEQIRERLSDAAVRRAGAQVRPSLPVQEDNRKGKGGFRGRR
ncbi:hypothetical protein ACFTZI_32605 [Streptomyces decoyicus]|uniref:hypothetical protein n=1 Tax=Streptomyces decoyicus TaxID=249567 RepID=UPI0036293539